MSGNADAATGSGCGVCEYSRSTATRRAGVLEDRNEPAHAEGYPDVAMTPTVGLVRSVALARG